MDWKFLIEVFLTLFTAGVISVLYVLVMAGVMSYFDSSSTLLFFTPFLICSIVYLTDVTIGGILRVLALIFGSIGAVLAGVLITVFICNRAAELIERCKRNK